MADQIGNWRIHDYGAGEGLKAGAASGSGDGWVAVSVPGDTYEALIAAGRLADPYKGRNEAKAEWVRDREWWWHGELELGEGERAALDFAGLDTFADIYLDGVLLGSADNMFRSWQFDLTDVAPGKHDLAICFHPTGLMTGDAPLPFWGAFTDRVSKSRRTAMRKAQYGWGWDWGPDLPTVGIWRPVEIVRKFTAVVRSVNFSTISIAEHSATVRVDVDLSGPAAVTIELVDPDGTNVARASLSDSGSVTLTIDSPQLWWTADLGAQPLYTLVARVDGAQDFTRQVGIRTVTIDQSPDADEPGATFFRFVLNGVPLFAKGANWIPSSSYVGTIPDEIYRDLLEQAVAANMNMMRVWGGGIYEYDIFYDLCDQLGLLVWQDFMFACAPYPEDDPALVENIQAEIEEQVSRLRHHASLALWCGNNENQAIHWFNDVATGEPSPLEGALYYDKLIPDALAKLDPDTFYWPGSPFGGPTPNSMRAGDVHDWTVWHGIPLVSDAEPDGPYASDPEGFAYTRYEEDKARFVSEFGLQAAADIGTLKRWMAPEDLTLGSEGFLERIKDIANKATTMMLPVTGLPNDIEDFVDFTMLCQAEGLKFGIEHFRRRKPHCSGALIWQHNDCWPCVSWSLIDYDGVAKSSFYTVTKAFAPVMASFRRDDDAAELWVINDTLKPLSGEATVALARFDGDDEWSEQIALEVAPNSSVCVWRGSAADSTSHVLTVRSDAFPANRRLLAPVKDIALSPDAGLGISYEEKGEALHITISAECYALAVRLRSDDPDLRFSDSHFDLADGEQHSVIATHRNGGKIERDAIAISCWNDRMKP